MLSLNGVNAAGESVKKTLSRRRLFFWAPAHNLTDTCCGTNCITSSSGPVMDVACFLFWQEG